MFAALTACTVQTDTRQRNPEPSAQSLIYGNDDRLEVYEHPSAALRKLAERSTLALIPRAHLQRDGSGSFHVVGPTLADLFGVCRDQRFTEQSAVAECTGVLIDDDLVLTAGHCLESEGDCASFAFVFDYFYRGEHVSGADAGAARVLAPEPIGSSDVYSCRTIVARRHAYDETTRLDFAVVQLDRAAAGRAPVSIRKAPLRKGEPLTTIGCTSGVPFKIDSGAHALSIGAPRYDSFLLDSDTFAGSSGSGVFDGADALIGVIGRGGADYEPRADAACNVPIVASVDAAPDAGLPPGEEATYAARAIESLCDAGWPSQRLCNIEPRCGDGFCSAGETPPRCAQDCDAGAEHSTIDAAPAHRVVSSKKIGGRALGCSVGAGRVRAGPSGLRMACLYAAWLMRRLRGRGSRRSAARQALIARAKW
jgi:hypothetical protein